MQWHACPQIILHGVQWRDGQTRVHIIQIAALDASMHVLCRVNWDMIGWYAPTSSHLALASSPLNIKQVWVAMSKIEQHCILILI
jgi:hypothetical protein